MFVLRGELFLTYHGSAGSPSVPGTNAGRCHPTDYETSRLRLVIEDEEKLAATLNGGTNRSIESAGLKSFSKRRKT
jgi:hypothetical protein